MTVSGLWKGTPLRRDSREPFKNILVFVILWCENDVRNVWLGLDNNISVRVGES